MSDAPMLHIGNDDKHESASDTAAAIGYIFRYAREQSMDQHVVEVALEAFGRVAEIKNVNITNCTFLNDSKAESTAIEANLPEDNDNIEGEDNE